MADVCNARAQGGREIIEAAHDYLDAFQCFRTFCEKHPDVTETAIALLKRMACAASEVAAKPAWCMEDLVMKAHVSACGEAEEAGAVTKSLVRDLLAYGESLHISRH